ncbi:MAG: 2-amino-4-hydroxy-6-hydroxymethyldihydropteridine diphosphokinase [Deltaproteobacteria bacterium]|nr:2-amino-4-hydroxy-6-hydroxymethyldihydropteridine diphosphokinase [Deltaproteobacteria bacterium]MBW2419079.1 2-amino-4-hydroxy-6-hydroxymethyldihydropteridine diphosphokinase [Deltaproteobacteria bacterium]
MTAYLALGSNLGEREALLVFAVEALAATPGIEVVAVSRIYETDPVGPGPQGAYLNAVMCVESGLEPRALLDRMLAVEREAGRERPSGALRWGPRTLDLDLLLYGDRCFDEPGLCVPHPRLHERAFVLEPLCELASETLHPRLGEPISAWAARQRDPSAVRPLSASASWKAVRRRCGKSIN